MEQVCGEEENYRRLKNGEIPQDYRYACKKYFFEDKSWFL